MPRDLLLDNVIEQVLPNCYSKKKESKSVCSLSYTYVLSTDASQFWSNNFGNNASRRNSRAELQIGLQYYSQTGYKLKPMSSEIDSQNLPEGKELETLINTTETVSKGDYEHIPGFFNVKADHLSRL
ncbi:hypothetical protein ACTFIW_000931 [Dictyostelium discoideum]